MKIERNSYTIYKVSDKKYAICKVLNDYDTYEKARKDLKKLIISEKDKKKGEQKLLDKFNKKNPLK